MLQSLSTTELALRPLEKVMGQPPKDPCEGCQTPWLDCQRTAAERRPCMEHERADAMIASGEEAR